MLARQKCWKFQSLEKSMSKMLIQKEIMIFILSFIMYQFMCQYGLSKTNSVIWSEITVEYTITMAQFGQQIKHPMVRRKSFGIILRKIHFDIYALLQRFISDVTTKLTISPHICNVKCVDETKLQSCFTKIAILWFPKIIKMYGNRKFKKGRSGQRTTQVSLGD